MNYLLNFENISLVEAFNYCSELTKRTAKNFYYSFVFLPKSERNAIYTIYAFCRIADDLADADEVSIVEKEQQFIVFDKLFDDCFKNDDYSKIKHPVFKALNFVVKKYQLSREYLEGIIIGVRSDLYKTKYSTEQELFDYCYKVAGCVAFVCIELFLSPKQRTNEIFKYGEALGRALQLTNILRDIVEDANKQRRYIPIDWIKNAELTELEYNQIISNLTNFAIANNKKQLNNLQRKTEFYALQDFKSIKKLLDSLSEKINYYYSECDKFIDKEQREKLRTLEIIKKIYSEIFKKIQNDYSTIFFKDTSIATLKKLKIALLTCF